MRILFEVIAILGLLTALGAVLARNLVHAALYLVGFFFLVACMFVLLEAEFIAAMQVLIYIGAVAILLLFGIMLTRNIQGDETTAGHWAWKLPAAAVGLGMLGLLVFGIDRETGPSGSTPWTMMGREPAVRDDQGNLSPRGEVINNMGKGVGDQMMTRFAVPFEVAGLLLTVALVGAIALAQHDPIDDETRGVPATSAVGGANGRSPKTTPPEALIGASAGPASTPR